MLLSGPKSPKQSMNLLNQILNLLLTEEAKITYSTQPKLAIEMIFIKMFQLKPAIPIDKLIEKLDKFRQEFSSVTAVEPGMENKYAVQTIAEDAFGFQKQPDIETTDIKPRITETRYNPNDSIDDTWRNITAIISDLHPSFAANLAKSALNKLTDNGLEIKVNGNGFNIDMIRRSDNLDKLKRVCEKYFGKAMEVIIKTGKVEDNGTSQKRNRTNHLKQKALNHPLMGDVIEMFDAKVVDIKIL